MKDAANLIAFLQAYLDRQPWEYSFRGGPWMPGSNNSPVLLHSEGFDLRLKP